MRLYGFYLPFEATTHVGPIRSEWLANDLAALGVGDRRRGSVARCAALPVLDNPDAVMGALYMVEGSALGGHGLARKLGALLGECDGGRQYFSCAGADIGNGWRAFLATLAAVPADAAARARVVAGATGTFDAFEQWLGGWESMDHG